MFLNRLNQDEKVAFLELAHHIARSDDSLLTKEEESIIEKYCMEMQIEDVGYDESKFDIYDTLGKIQNTKSCKIVLLELMALIYSDDYLHEKERAVLEIILEEFDLSHSLSIVYTQWAKTMLSLFVQGNALIEL